MAMHHLNDAIMRNPDVIQSALHPYTEACSFMRMDVERQVARIKNGRRKPRLYLPFAVYVIDAEAGAPVLINTNTAGGEPIGVEHAVRLARERRDDTGRSFCSCEQGKRTWSVARLWCTRSSCQQRRFWLLERFSERTLNASSRARVARDAASPPRGSAN